MNDKIRWMGSITGIGRALCFFLCFVGVIFLTILIWYEAPRFERAEAKVAGSRQLLVKQLSAGTSHTCAVLTTGAAYCWGYGWNGRLGNGSTDTQPTPVPVSQGAIPSGVSILQVSAGSNHTCAVASDNKAYCWGVASNGQLGNGATSGDFTTPVAVSQGAMPSGATIRQITVGISHTCAIASDNKAYCWGSNGGRLGNGSLNSASTPVAVSQGAMPSGATIRQLTAGSTHTCAIASDNKAYCWGVGSSGQLGNGSTPTYQTTPVAVSQGAMPSGATIRKISNGNSHSCAIASDNLAYCWGLSSNGQLGNGTTTPDQSTPVAVSQGDMPSGSTARDIMTGDAFSCVIASDNLNYCWGSGSYGQMGNGLAPTSQSTPVAVSQGDMPSGTTSHQITAGFSHACAATSDNKAYCWGRNNYRQLGTGLTSGSYTTPKTVVAIQSTVEVAQSVFRTYGPSATTTPGSPLAAANTAATLSSIASDFRIRIGLTNLEPSSTQLKTHTVTAGGTSTCAIASDNKAYCWGGGGSGQLGNGTSTASQTIPVAVSQGVIPSGATITQISAGTAHTCAIASDHKAYCWGNGFVGQLGTGSPAQETTPVAVAQGAMPSGATIRQIVTGNYQTCAIASNNQAYCWGYNNYGELGDNSITQRNSPVAVAQGAIPSGSTILQLAAGSNHTCAIASDHKAYCWGEGTYGQLGNGSTPSTQTTPVAVSLGAMPAGSTILQITASLYHTCVVASDHKSYCWGYGPYGQVGDGSGSQQNSPVAVAQGAIPSGVTIVQVAAGNTHTCAIASDGKSYCWGYSSNGQIGDGSSTIRYTPVAASQGSIPSGVTSRQITANGTHTCIAASDDNVYCWGAAGNGRLGNNSTSPDRNTPVAISSGAMTETGPSISASQLSLDLQVAPLGLAATCSAVASGWTAVSTTSEMNWGSSPPSHTTAISSFGSDPAAPTGAGYAYQSIVRSAAFTNAQAIAPQQTGLWDFVLHDRSSKSATSYCLRIVSNTVGTAIDTYSHYPQITTAPGSLATQFVNGSGTPITSPATNSAFSSGVLAGSVQTTTASLVNITDKQLEAHNSTSNSGWGISLAATGGPTATWVSGSNSYPYNSAISNNGQLSVNMTSSSRTAHGTDPTGAACTITGTNLGTGTASFSDVVSAITLITGSPSAQFNCSWRLRDVTLSQTIPAYQPSGSYTLDLTATIVAN